MKQLYNKVIESKEYIESKMQSKPQIGIILGSGLGGLTDKIENRIDIPYDEIPNFPVVTVKGHDGRMILGTINGVEVLAMKGRFHYYEGYTMKEVTYPVFVMKMLGIEHLIVTNACGGINKNFAPGDLMIINDFINLFGDNPLIGANDERFGKRFPDMTEPYCLESIKKAKEVAESLSISYKEGVYAGFMGPYYETAAEIKAYGGMGADAIGMSTVPETIVANYLQMKVLGISCITNMATGIQEKKHSHDDVVDVANKASKTLCHWVENVVTVL